MLSTSTTARPTIMCVQGNKANGAIRTPPPKKSEQNRIAAGPPAIKRPTPDDSQQDPDLGNRNSVMDETW